MDGADGRPIKCLLQTSFPGNLQLVLVLRPTGLLHRTLFDIAFKFHRDDYKMKLPVSTYFILLPFVICNLAIESFARMVKQTAQTLRSFGAELAETELPNDVDSTRSLLTEHTENKVKMKEDLRIAVEQGHDILHSIRKPVLENPEYKMNPDQMENQVTVERLLAQLDETSTAFDDFWTKHQQKLEQCLQLRHFELDFKEVKSDLETVFERLSHFTEMGNNCSHVEHILKDLANFEDKSHDVLEKAEMLISTGDQFIQNNHYAVDSIFPNCVYLLLFFSVSIYLQSMRWCDEGIYLLASQLVDKCQTQDGAESALQEIEKFLDTGGENKLKELNNLCKEYEAILSEELMEHIQKVFQKQESMEEMFQKRQVSLKKLAAKQTRPVQPVAPRPEVSLKSPCPSPGLQRDSEDSSSPDNHMLQRTRRVKSEMNEINQTRGGSMMDDEENLAVLRKHVINELLETERAYVEELLCVLEEMLKYSKNCEGAEDLQEALTSILGILKAVNDSMHQIAITGYDGNMNELGKLLMQGSFNVWTDHKKGHSKVKDLARFKPMQRHLFLHEKAILFCKKREENGEGYEKAPSYSYKHSLNAPTPEVKATWVNAIRKVLTSQLQACRQASQHRILEHTHSLPLPASFNTSPSRNDGRNFRKQEERNCDLVSPDGCVTSVVSKYPEKGKGRESYLTGDISKPNSVFQYKLKASPISPDKNTKRHEVKSDPTPLGLRGWSKASQSVDASEENDGWSSAEDPFNSSDAEEEGKGEKKLIPGKYTAVANYDKGGSEDLVLKSGDLVQLLHEGEDGLWYIKNLSTSREGWVPVNSLLALLGNSKSALSLNSSESVAGSSTLSSSSSYSESCNVSNASVSDIKG
ncbi:hypothetical protein JD844_032154 [Phrynosoma platyrhinos]|uniref:SH3 domain-containing protein n=1 Tax=Phrynosoma platyrhinos TaxID=52577 RepID=A0ABQ7T480_PHRPL|nr:hypothetical protein JD844_032154 [Phrynosoma platyrhinos]